MLGGVKHFGYYPLGQENIQGAKAQELMNEQLALSLSLPEGSKVLDAGCGEGSVALYLAKRCKYEITGIDLLDFDLDRARQNVKRLGFKSQISFFQADYSDTGLPDSSFDAIYTMETLVHSPDFKRTITEFHRLLKPGGKLVLVEYSKAPKEELSLEAQQAFTRVNHLSAMPAFEQFAYGVLEHALVEGGFEAIQSRDITERMLPMLRKFYRLAKIPFYIVSSLGLEDHFVNAMSAVVFIQNLGSWKYNIIKAYRRR